MVKEKNNSKNNEEKLINLQSNLNLNDIHDENFKEEVLSIYNAINEGKLDLNPEEKKELLQELDLIINYFDSNERNDDAIDSESLSKSLDEEDINSDFEAHNSSKDYNNLDSENNSHFQNDDSVSVDDSLNELVDDGVVDDSVSVDDSLNELVDDGVVDSIDDGSSDDEVVDEHISVDDALNELIDDDVVDSVDYDSFDDDFVDERIPVVDASSDDDFVDEHISVDDALNDLIEEYSNEVAIRVKNVSMDFKVSKDKIDTFKEFVIRTIKRNKSATKILRALDDVSFEIPKGDRVGIIGFNGAGKSTLLKVLAGVYDATEGTIETNGNIAPLLELGAGFDPNYTGKDNIFLNGAFLGYSEEFLNEKYDEIVEFSELGEAINYHVKTYSSGMRAKLGFAIATIVEPDILILDELLSVGDIRFRKKSADKIRSLINSGITVLLVSHSIGQIRDLCNKAIWIDEGKLMMYGEVNEVCDAYVKAASSATTDQLDNIQLN